MQIPNKLDINHYLFLEFGFDINPNHSETLISETYPFTLNNTENPTIFTFFHDTIPYYVVTDHGLNFFPVQNLTILDLEMIKRGSGWIGERGPINLNTSRLGDERVPSAIERRNSIQALVQSFLGTASFQILEGLFLIQNQKYLALVQLTNTAEFLVIGTDLPILTVAHPHITSHRRLSLAIGQALLEGTISSQY